MSIKEKILDRFKRKDSYKWKIRAEEYAGDKKKTGLLLKDAVVKAEAKRNGPLAEVWDKLQLLFKLVKDWASGEYTGISKGAMVWIIAGLVYFVSPIDIIPDVVVGMGLLDDATVLGFIIKQVNSEVEVYRAWRESRAEKLN